jgi:thymidylate synthase
MLGMPYDIFLFTMWQEMMAAELQLDVGPYHHVVGSLHIYESNLEWSKEILCARSSITEPMPRMLTLTGIDALLQGEPQTRNPEADQIYPEGANGYWFGLLEVLRYCNGIRLGEVSDSDLLNTCPLYRELVDLRRGAKFPHPAI